MTDFDRLDMHNPDRLDIYIGIPFCASRCSYCSFAAEALKDYARAKAYLLALFREIDACKDIAGRFGVRALYIGGGTPTSLSARDFERLLEKAAGFAPALEFAVEAGRPDTLSHEKLALMKRFGVTRTSVNPQTMSDATLARIGRAHTAADTIRAFELTREYGLPINADIIVGLPGETPLDVEQTLLALDSLAPEGFTAHTLALKRASRLVMKGESALPPAKDAETMLALTQDFALNRSMNPYYLYRQKYMAGNLENVGYAKPGFECLYNIDIMEETTSILAFGAGAITKWVFGAGRLERAPNPKDVDTYIGKVDSLIGRKRTLSEAN
jgi:oxygen-independent coproporphyrinogen-3 oxidase